MPRKKVGKENDKRRFNPGRPKSQDPTVPVRLPSSLAEFVMGNLELIRKMMEKMK